MKSLKEKQSKEYHDTLLLLRKYRDVRWSLEASVQHVQKSFLIEYGSNIEDFLESIYLAGADLQGSRIESHARCIEQSYQMLKLVDSAVNSMRERHKNGELYYWILYYTYLSPQALSSVEEIIEKLQHHTRDMSRVTYFRKREDAVETLSTALWGFTSKDCIEVLNHFFPNQSV